MANNLLGYPSKDEAIEKKFKEDFVTNRSHLQQQSSPAQKYKIQLPYIKKSKQKDQSRMGTESFVKEILDSQTNYMSDVIPLKKMHKKNTPEKTKSVRREFIDLRKKERKGCGSIKCKICNPEKSKRRAIQERSKKQRVHSLSREPAENSHNDPIISQALQENRRTRKRKITHITELNEEGKFNIIPLRQEPKPKKVESLMAEKQLDNEGRTFYQQVKVNGKLYLIKKKRRMAKHFEEDAPLQYSRAIPPTGGYEYERNLRVQSEMNEYREEDTKARMWELEKYRQEERRRSEREFLNEEVRKFIHLETSFQTSKKMINRKPQKKYEKMFLNNDYGEEDGRDKTGDSFDIDKKVQQHNNRSKREEDKSYRIKFPTVSEINEAINSYVPLTKLIDVFLLKKKPNFIREHNQSPGQEFFYFGEFDNDRKERTGKGVLVTKGRILEGIWQKGEILEGAELKENGVYKGQFLGRRKHGEGFMEWNNGEKYQGEWRYGKRHGKGRWKSSEKEEYFGEWSAGKATGYGELTSKDGIYKGNFQNFVKHGRGRQLFPNGDIYAGYFEEGEPNGYGKYIWKSGLIYEGEFKDSIREGRGKLILEEVFLLDGKFEKDLPHGICCLKLVNGDEYTGRYLFGDQHGYGEEQRQPKRLKFSNNEWSSDILLRSPKSSDDEYEKW